MEALYIELRGEDVPLRLSVQSASNFSPNLSVTANSPASWLPYTFVYSEVVLWVSDGRPLLQLYRISSPTAAYAVFLKKRPGNQVQLGPRLFISIAVSQDAAMEMIAKNIFGYSPFRWSELRQWKDGMREIYAINGYGMEEVHHFGAELLLPRRFFSEPSNALGICHRRQTQKCVHSSPVKSHTVLAQSGVPSCASDLAYATELDCSLGGHAPRPAKGEHAEEVLCTSTARCARRHHRTSVCFTWLRHLCEARQGFPRRRFRRL